VSGRQQFGVGHGGSRVWIDPDWRVLDVGSGNFPHPRADVLLEKWADENADRAGDSIDKSDNRLVIGDACDMPFPDQAFDYVIASNIAEHVDDPEALCRELPRVGRAGFIETPGWLGDMVLREDFHRWRVSRHSAGLQFLEVDGSRPFGFLGEAFYAVLYLNQDRPGHRTITVRNGALALPLKVLQRLAGVFIHLPVIREAMYTCFEWEGPFSVTVRRLPPDRHPTSADSGGSS
jgi:SAM-dependent methyltransferase